MALRTEGALTFQRLVWKSGELYGFIKTPVTFDLRGPCLMERDLMHAGKRSVVSLYLYLCLSPLLIPEDVTF